METHMLVRLVLGPLIFVAAGAIAARRIWFPYRMVSAGQPSRGRLDDWQQRLLGQVVELFGRCRLLKGEIPGGTEYLFWAGCAGALEDRSSSRPARPRTACRCST